MKRAFILHKRAQDLEAAAGKVDEVRVVIDGKFYPFDPGELFKKIEEGMSSIDPEKDYVVPSGSTLVSFLAGFYLGQGKNPKRLKLMVHDVKSNQYREVVFLPPGRSSK